MNKEKIKEDFNPNRPTTWIWFSIMSIGIIFSILGIKNHEPSLIIIGLAIMIFSCIFGGSLGKKIDKHLGYIKSENT